MLILDQWSVKMVCQIKIDAVTAFLKPVAPTSNSIYELIFDDVADELKSFTEALTNGCTKLTPFRSSECNCFVSEREIQ